MKTLEEQLAVGALALAVRGALLALIVAPLGAVAADENADVTALTKPSNTVEVGVQNVSQKSAKFGEYNGLNDSGPYFIGNFWLRGGDAYGAYGGSTGANRWELKGTDLGTTSREVSGAVSNQGRWNLGVNYSELRHYGTDSYQTPNQGSLGGDRFVIPPAFGIIDANSADIGSQGITAVQKTFFHTEDVYTSRKNAGINAGYIFNRQWSAQFDYNHLDQSGGKLIGASFDATGGGAGEFTTTLITPTNYRTDTFELALNWVGERAHAAATYSASIFTDGYSSFSASNPFFDGGGGTTGTPPAGGAFPMNVFPTAPGNTFQQLSLTGGYDLASATKLAGGFSFGRNRQDESFINDPLLTSAMPATSLNGLVVTTHADFKLTDQSIRNLALSAGLKYDERDNRTPSYTVASFVSVAGDPWGPTVSAPMSHRKYQLELAGSYRIDKRQTVRLAYDYDVISRWCNNAIANSAQSTDPTALLAYYTGQSCVQVPKNKENRLSANYKLKALENLSLTAGYSYGKRRADINGAFYNPMQTSAEGFENFGYIAFFQAPRTENLAKAGINWQAGARINVGLNGRYVHDEYDATLGVQHNHTWSMNLDAAYNYAEAGSVLAYVSVQQRKRDLSSSADKSPIAPSTNLWSNELKDDNTTLGLNARQKGLLHGRLDLTGDVSYSFGKSTYSTQTPLCTDVTLCDVPANNSGTLPDIKNEMLRFRLTGQYQLSHSSRISLGYLFQKLKSDDYYYSAYQMGSTDILVLPTNQQAPNYSVSLISASYIYSF